MLCRSNYFDCKHARTAFDRSVKLFKNTRDGVKETEYASIIGSLRMPLDVLDPTLPLPWQFYSSLQVDILRSVKILLEEL